MNRCEKTEIPVDQCAHCLGHTGVPDKVEATSGAMHAQYSGNCGHCDERFPVGTPICWAVIDGHSAVVIAEHTR